MGKVIPIGAQADPTTIYQIDAVELARFVVEIQNQAKLEAIDLANEQPLTTEGAAEFLGVHKGTLLRWCNEGRIPANICHRDANMYWFFKSELSAFVKSK